MSLENNLLPELSNLAQLRKYLYLCIIFIISNICMQVNMSIAAALPEHLKKGNIFK